MVFAIDFDGTIAKHKYPEIGDEVPGAIDVLKKLIEQGHTLILYTMRSGRSLTAAISWCYERGVQFNAVNNNPDQESWTSSRKVYAHVYVDDAALGCPLVKEEQERPYVNWEVIEQALKYNKIIET